MTADVTETVDQAKLLEDFRSRYTAALKENEQLARKIKDNETQALKLLGAIETLEYLSQGQEVDELDAE
jgi:hypothetical protein